MEDRISYISNDIDSDFHMSAFRANDLAYASFLCYERDRGVFCLAPSLKTS